MKILSLVLWHSLVAAESPSVDYGEVFVEESAPRELPKVAIDANASLDLDDSFSDLKSYTINAQMRVWKYVGTGILFQHYFPSLSNAGRELQNLETSGVFELKIPQPEWGIFWHTQIQLLAGDWNFLNLFPMQADFLVGGGVGSLRQRTDVAGGRSKSEMAYLWSVGQRLRFYKRFGLNASIFGHSAGTYGALGFVTTF